MDKKTKNIIICVTVLIAVTGTSFYAGVIFSKNNKTSRFNAQGFGNGNISENTSFNKQANTNSNFGEIIAKDEKSITIKLSSGGSKIILFSESTQINKLSRISVQDLELGENIMVQGTVNSDGSVSAKTIQTSPQLGDFQNTQNQP